jgi:hypothetical protein
VAHVSADFYSKNALSTRRVITTPSLFTVRMIAHFCKHLALTVNTTYYIFDFMQHFLLFPANKII